MSRTRATTKRAPATKAIVLKLPAAPKFPPSQKISKGQGLELWAVGFAATAAFVAYATLWPHRDFLVEVRHDFLTLFGGVGTAFFVAGCGLVAVRFFRHHIPNGLGCLFALLGGTGFVGVFSAVDGGETGRGIAEWLSAYLAGAGAAVLLLATTSASLVLVLDFRHAPVAGRCWWWFVTQLRASSMWEPLTQWWTWTRFCLRHPIQAMQAARSGASAPAVTEPPPPAVATLPVGEAAAPPVEPLAHFDLHAMLGGGASQAPALDPNELARRLAKDDVALGTEQLPLEPPPNGHGQEGPPRTVTVRSKPGAMVVPSIDLLNPVEPLKGDLAAELEAKRRIIDLVLQTYGVESKVDPRLAVGPTVTRFDVPLPVPLPRGFRVKKILDLLPELRAQMGLPNHMPIRPLDSVPGKAAVGFEIPNTIVTPVTLGAVLRSQEYRDLAGRGLPLALGVGAAGYRVPDLASSSTPHLLIAGATGGGKSVCLNALLLGLLLQATPQQLRVLILDIKRVEFAGFDGVPHILMPPVVETAMMVKALRRVVYEMEERYKLLAGRARNIDQYNALPDVTPLPQIVVVADEIGDLMMVAGVEIEALVCRIAQLGRAAGIHIIVATQSPRVEVITGEIKANLKARVAFAVSSGVDSRVILDEMGAEKLLGNGDMVTTGFGQTQRLQGPWVDEKEIDRVLGAWKEQGKPDYWRLLPEESEE